ESGWCWRGDNQIATVMAVEPLVQERVCNSCPTPKLRGARTMTLTIRVLKVFAALFAAVVLAGSPSSRALAQADPHRPLKVALVLPGPVSDGTFNSAAAKGMKAAQAKYPNITVSIRENTGMAQSEAALFEYASNGYDVVIGHGFQFAEGAKKIHNQFPKTWFIINTAKIAEAPNLASFDNRWGDV